MENLIEIVHEDADLLVVDKPAGLVCHPTKGDVYSSLISRLRLHFGTAARPQLVNRLDRETSGVVLVAKTDSAARELRALWENRAVTKEYLAIVHGHVSEAGADIEAPLGRDERSRVAIKDCVRADGAPAQTRFEVMSRFARGTGKFTWLRVFPRTGRKHQIRIHLAHIGHPIVGDKLYGGDEELYLAFVESRLASAQWERLLLPNHALHARAVRFRWRGGECNYCAEPDSHFKEFLSTGRNVAQPLNSSDSILRPPNCGDAASEELSKQ